MALGYGFSYFFFKDSKKPSRSNSSITVSSTNWPKLKSPIPSLETNSAELRKLCRLIRGGKENFPAKSSWVASKILVSWCLNRGSQGRHRRGQEARESEHG